jgi:hypothetical protein
MPLSKKDAPAAAAAAGVDDQPNTYTDDPETVKDAKQSITDAGAGAPPGYEDEAEALPEHDEVQKATKDAMLADTGQEEAQAKVRAVDESPDAAETPSGGALKATAHIADNVERGEAYAREKSARRHGYVTPDLAEKSDK